MRRFIGLVAVLAVAVIAWFVVPELFMSEEARVERELRAMLTAFNQRQVKPIADRLADDFREETLRTDRAEFVAFALYATKKQVPITAELLDDELVVEVDDEVARVEARVRFTRGIAGGASESRPAVATLEFAKVDGEWMLRRSEHTWPEGRLRVR